MDVAFDKLTDSGFRYNRNSGRQSVKILLTHVKTFQKDSRFLDLNCHSDVSSHRHGIADTFTMSFELNKGFFFFCFDGQADPSMQPLLQIMMLKRGLNLRLKMTDGLLQYSSIITTEEAAEAANLDLNNPGTPIICVGEWKCVTAAHGNQPKPCFKIERFEIVQRFAPLVNHQFYVFSGDVNAVREYINSLGLTASGMSATNSDCSKRPKLMNQANDVPDLTPPSVLNHKSPITSVASRNTVAINWQHFSGTNIRPNTVPNRTTINPDNQRKEMPITQFIMLNPFINKFRICGVCTGKEGIRDIHTATRGDLKVFSFILYDEKERSLKVTAWNDQAVETDPLIIVGHTYYIDASSANIRRKSRYNYTDLDYELVLGPTTELYGCADRTISLPKLKLNRVPIASLAPTDKAVDVLAVVDNVSEITTVISKTKGELRKREVELVDDSNAKVNLVLWEDKALEWNANEGDVISIKNVLIREFMGGLSLSLCSQSQPEVMPDIDEAQILHAWYREERLNNFSIVSMSTQNAGANNVEEIRTLIWSEKHQFIDEYPNGINFTARVIIDEVRRENMFYQACMTCNKKVTQVDHGWHCDKCSITTTDSETRYMLNIKVSDFTGSVFTTVFGETATDLLGIEASDLKKMAEEDLQAFNNVFKNIQFSNVFIRLKVRTEYYNDQKRRKHTVVSFKNVQPEVFNSGLDATVFALENL